MKKVPLSWRRPVLLGALGVLVVLFGKETVIGAIQSLSMYFPAQ